MPHVTPTQEQTQADVKRLDEIIAHVQSSHGFPKKLVLEHLNAARVYLTGSMPDELIMALQDARDAAATLTDNDLRASVRHELRDFLKQITDQTQARSAARPSTPAKPNDPPPSGVKSPLWSFFGESPMQAGSFYPRSFLIAILPSFESAEAAEKALWQAGIGRDEVRAVRGADMLRFLEELRRRRSIWGEMMAWLSDLMGTEEVFVHNDRRYAREGAGFIAAFSPTEQTDSRIRETLAPFGPISIQKYSSGGVESMIPPRKTSGPEL